MFGFSRDAQARVFYAGRHDYNVKALADLLDTEPSEVRSFLQGTLTPVRAQELQNNLLAIGIPL